MVFSLSSQEILFYRFLHCPVLINKFYHLKLFFIFSYLSFHFTHYFDLISFLEFNQNFTLLILLLFIIIVHIFFSYLHLLSLCFLFSIWAQQAFFIAFLSFFLLFPFFFMLLLAELVLSLHRILLHLKPIWYFTYSFFLLNQELLKYFKLILGQVNAFPMIFICYIFF